MRKKFPLVVGIGLGLTGAAAVATYVAATPNLGDSVYRQRRRAMHRMDDLLAEGRYQFNRLTDFIGALLPRTENPIPVRAMVAQADEDEDEWEPDEEPGRINW